MLKLEYYLKALEDERKKIEAFKRELPFCMQLLNDEIEASKEQIADHQEPAIKPQSTLTSVCEENQSVMNENVRPVLEEFMPIKKPADDAKEDDTTVDIGSGSKCLKSAQLPNGVMQTKFWTPAEAYVHGQEMVSSMTDKPYKKRDSMRVGGEDTEVAKPILNPQKRGGAFVPFCGSKRLQTLAEHLAVEALPLVRDRDASPTPCADMARSSTISVGVRHRHDLKETQNVAVATPTTSYTNAIGQGTQRKPRRCWSPELHRRFVNALQQLGGSEVATPKQIRELMKVDGLTNDEVKSHLQKYRLHTRRPNPSFHTASAHAPQVVVLGGIWVPPEYAAQAAVSVSQSMPNQQESAERQATHVQATPSYSEERYNQLNTTAAGASTSQLQLHPALYGFNGDARPAVTTTQSQGSSQGPLHQLSSGHSASDAGREEESEEGNEGCTSWKDEDRSTHEANGKSLFYAPLHVHKWIYNKDSVQESGDDDSEAEDGRVYETHI
ncbi:hypothetical protein GOP47_0024340 [Adiantum capillus-veneris]|uniref:HTH myb-type domain-containing protein n=1 Tax=Adiantum capillus-veneris TaxID=13818 RepID=A0A9D4Z3K0_ADICA|nr:hypothetical protein GOP47_0024340 [Adiantum capillus-veneris]